MPGLLDRLKAALADRYRVDREITLAAKLEHPHIL